MSSDVPVVIVASRDGTVVAQNIPARQLMGPRIGEFCWKVVGGLEQTEGLPCHPGCVRGLVRAGLDGSQRARCKLDGRSHELSCIPLDEAVVCVLSRATNAPATGWQMVTAREREVLQLLADGETTSSAAARLGVRESTIRSHVEKIRVKLGVSTRAAVVARGFRLGLLD